VSHYKQADETRWLVFVEVQGKVGFGWWLWAFSGNDTVVYILEASRSHQLWQINPRLWLHWYLQSCAKAGGQAAKEIEEFLPWNLSGEKRAKLCLSGSEQKPDTS
jgi:hypothetical protein